MWTVPFITGSLWLGARSHNDWLGDGQLEGDGRKEETLEEGGMKGQLWSVIGRRKVLRREERDEWREGRWHGVHVMAPFDFLFLTSQKEATGEGEWVKAGLFPHLIYIYWIFLCVRTYAKHGDKVVSVHGTYVLMETDIKQIAQSNDIAICVFQCLQRAFTREYNMGI